MLASLPASDPPLVAKDLVYEPKYDGIRAIALVEPAQPQPRIRFWSRLGNEKTSQFPELAATLATWAREINVPIVLDGEIVALDDHRRPAGFQRLQGRIHVTVPGYRSSRPITSPQEQPTAFIAFDLLRDGDDDLRALPLVERRARLARLFEEHPPTSDALRLSEQAVGDGRTLLARARKEGWEGLVVKAARSPYRDGRRTPEWRKMKITNEDEFVVGGWTEPKGARSYFGSLILGTHDEAGRLVHAGDCGTGFSGAELERLWKLLKPLETSECPFYVKPKTLGRPHWAKPKLVVQVRYTEWTDDGRLRHPTYLGLRDDKRPEEVKTTRRGSKVPEFQGPKVQGSKVEGSELQKFQGSMVSKSGGSGSNRGRNSATSEPSNPGTSEPRNLKASEPRTPEPRNPEPSDHRRPRTPDPRRSARDPLKSWTPAADAMTAQLDAFEANKRDGKLRLPDGDTLDVTNLHKIFWPGPPYTKGDLLRYYARVAPLILPVIDDRPLVMKRFPNGIQGEAFYQHRGPEKYPRGVRVEPVPGADVPTMFVGGDLKTLLYMAQLASISMDPWFSKMESLDEPDLVALDLDPQPGATFDQILDVSRWVREELDRLKVPGFPKTSGSEGLHIFIPLAPGTSYEAGVLFCQIVATIVATKHPKVATIERMVRRRKERTVYVDYLQNIPGKTLACAYSARASAFAGVSAPLKWEEIDDKIRPQDFTIKTMETRVRSVGDLWAALRKSKPADLTRALEKLAK